MKGVGKNLRNHGAVSLAYTVNNPNRTLLLTVQERDMENEIIKYQEIPRRGILTETNYAQGLFVSSRAKAAGEHHWPDIQVGFSQQPTIAEGSPLRISSSVKIGRMKSSGEIKLNVTAYLNGERNDLKIAEIDHQAFSVRSDVEVLIEGIQ